jgi:hypothetical protein
MTIGKQKLYTRNPTLIDTKFNLFLCGKKLAYHCLSYGIVSKGNAPFLVPTYRRVGEPQTQSGCSVKKIKSLFLPGIKLWLSSP